MIKKILITGANGLLGQKIIYGYKGRADIQLIATGKGSCRINNTKGYIYEEMDITNRQSILKVVEKTKPDVIINAAAMTDVDACEGNHSLCDKINVKAVATLSSVCDSKNIHLIHISTDFIFDGEDGPYDEKAEANPLSYYGWSKLRSEDFVNTSPNLWTIIRTVLVIGITDNMSRSNIVLWAKGALEKGQIINVVNDQFRSPTLAEDLADGCMLAALQGAKGVYNISGKDFMSVLELVQRVAKFYKLDQSLIHPSTSKKLNQPAMRPPVTGFILDKAIKELGYNPHTFEEALAIMDAQMKKRES